MGEGFKLVSVISLLFISNAAFSDTISNPSIRGYQLLGAKNGWNNAQQFCIENGYTSGQPLNEVLVLGVGGADFDGVSWRFIEVPDSVRYPKIANVECSGRIGPGPNPWPGPGPGPGPNPWPGNGEVVQNPTINGYLLTADGNYGPVNANRFCVERGYRNGGRVLNTQWIVRAPAAYFNGASWQYSPNADNYNAIQAVECLGRGGGGGGGGFPDRTFQRPLLNNYPLMASAETGDAYCRDQGFRRGQIQQTLYVDTNPCYYFRDRRWNFSPNADHYQMIEVLNCYRR